MQDLLDSVINIAYDAGKAIMEIYDSEDLEIQNKDDDGYISPLTQADKASHEVIQAGLTRVSQEPIISEEGDHSILESLQLDVALGSSEEQESRMNNTVSERESVTDTAQRQELQRVSSSAGEQAEAVRRFWLVDPLDGTKEFISKNGEFTVNIALIENGEPVLGVVYAPALKTLYAAVEGKAFKIGSDQIKISLEPDSAEKDVPKIVVSRNHKGDRLAEILSGFGAHEETDVGSSLKFCYLADGTAQAYPRLVPTYLWDTAASDAVLRATGGQIRDLNGNPLVYRPEENIKNPFFVATAKGQDALLSKFA